MMSDERGDWSPMDSISPLVERARETRVRSTIRPASVANDLPSPSRFGSIGDSPFVFRSDDLEVQADELAARCFTDENRRFPLAFFKNIEHKNRVHYFNNWASIIYGTPEESAAAEEDLRRQHSALVNDHPLRQPPNLRDVETPRRPSNRRRQPEHVPVFSLQLQDRPPVERLVHRDEMMPIAEENNRVMQRQGHVVNAQERRQVVELAPRAFHVPVQLENRQVVEQPAAPAARQNQPFHWNENVAPFVLNRLREPRRNRRNRNRQGQEPEQVEQIVPGHIDVQERHQEQPAVLRAEAQHDNRQGQVANAHGRRQVFELALAPYQQGYRQAVQPVAAAPPPNFPMQWNANAPVFVPQQQQQQAQQPPQRELLPRPLDPTMYPGMVPLYWIFINMEQMLEQMRNAVHSFQHHRQAAPVLPGPHNPQLPMCCGFCYGTAKDYAEGMNLRVPDKDSWGPWSVHRCKTGQTCTCPVLRLQTCDICGATGDNAHTTVHHRQKRAEGDPNFP